MEVAGYLEKVVSVALGAFGGMVVLCFFAVIFISDIGEKLERIAKALEKEKE